MDSKTGDGLFILSDGGVKRLILDPSDCEDEDMPFYATKVLENKVVCVHWPNGGQELWDELIFDDLVYDMIDEGQMNAEEVISLKKEIFDSIRIL